MVLFGAKTGGRRPGNARRLHSAAVGVLLTSLAWSLMGAAAKGQDRLSPDKMTALLAGSPPSKGAADAPVTVVAFIDFQCPSCRQFTEWLARLPADEGRSIRMVIHHKPFPFHTWAYEAAMVSVCIDLQDHRAFWKMHDYVFDQQAELTAQNVKSRLLDYAGDQLHMNTGAINACLDERRYETALEADRRLITDLNIRETPTVFIDGRRYVGFQSAEDLKVAIDTALGEVRRESQPGSTDPKCAGGTK